MRLPLIYKIISPFILVVFTITSCNFFSIPEPNTITVPLGKGDIRFVYLDEDNRPTINDIGKMAMYVENNELTKDVLVLAEIQNDNIDNDVVVRVINKQNNSLVSFFYYRGQIFPHKTVITIDGDTITGQFSIYNAAFETYSVEFTNKDGESEKYNNFILNKNVFSLHKKDNALTDTQNVRISHIITTLALWNSLAFQLDDNFKVGSRGIAKWLKNLLTLVFAVVAIVAVVAVIVLAPPAAITLTGSTLTVAITTTPQAIAAGVAIASGATAVIINGLPEIPDAQEGPSPNANRRPVIEITLDNNTIENNKMPPYYLKYDPVNKKGESLTFNIKVTDFGSPEAINISSINGLINWIEPTEKKFIYNNTNRLFFNVSVGSNTNNVYPIIIERIKDGYINEGTIQLVLKFGRDVTINKKTDGIDFWDLDDNPVEGKKDIFVINLTVKAL